MDSNALTPDHLPTLSPGRHANSAKGACFMEYASVLAGERWSDHPSCTDPVLAALARCVNDAVSDPARATLVTDIPRVIGLTGGDVLCLTVGLRAATEALPIAAEHHQRSLAVAAIGILGALAKRGVTHSPVIEAARHALAEVPAANAWALAYLERLGQEAMHLVVTGCTQTVRTAVMSIAEAVVPDPDERLVRTLRAAIADCEAALGRPEGIELGELGAVYADA